MKLVLMVGSRETTTAAEVMAHKEKNKTRVTGSTCMIGDGCVQGILAAAVMASEPGRSCDRWLGRAPPQNRRISSRTTRDGARSAGQNRKPNNKAGFRAFVLLLAQVPKTTRRRFASGTASRFQTPPTERSFLTTAHMSAPNTQRRKSLQDVQQEGGISPTTRVKRMSWAGLKQKVMSAAIGGSSADAESWNLDELPANFFEIDSVEDAKGNPLPLSQYQGKAALVLNVASF